MQLEKVYINYWGAVSLSGSLQFHSLSVAAVIQGSGPLIMTCPLASYSEVPQTVCVKKKGGKKEEKSIGFHYLVGQCHWPVNDPVTVVVQG